MSKDTLIFQPEDALEKFLAGQSVASAAITRTKNSMGVCDVSVVEGVIRDRLKGLEHRQEGVDELVEVLSKSNYMNLSLSMADANKIHDCLTRIPSKGESDGN